MATTARTTIQDDMGPRLRSVMQRFPRGLNLSREDLGCIGWLYCYERETDSQGIADSLMKRLIQEAAGYLEVATDGLQPAQTIQRLMRLGIVRLAITGSRRRGYRLTCLGQSIARNLMEETDYGAEQLNALLGSALRETAASALEGEGVLLRYLKFVFLGAMREKIEMKILAIEEDLEERKREVKRTYSGQQSDADLDGAIRDIEHCRAALTELVDAVKESSACAGLESLLHERMTQGPKLDLHEALEQSLNFIYLLRSSVEIMLKDVVDFIRECVAYRALALTVDSRDRLCRIQERILSFALDHDVRMPMLDPPRIPKLDLKWSRQERERPVVVGEDRLRALEGFLPPDPPAIEPEWKGALLDTARDEWKRVKRAVPIEEWLETLKGRVPRMGEGVHMAVWFLCQDWPNWVPKVSVEYRKGTWIPLDDEWMMEAVSLV
ncbi:MAG: hypothetical protein ACLGPL_03500, partial [Acidobacteriota bacterium]